MRRRQAYAGRSRSEAAKWLMEPTKPKGSVVQGEIAPVLGMKWSSAQKVGTAKGVCPSCGKHIGKGVTMHARHCK